MFETFLTFQPPLTPVYFAAALVLHRGAEVTRCEPDMAMVHHLLSKIPDELVRMISRKCQCIFRSRVSQNHFAVSALRAPLDGDGASLPRVPAVHVGEGREGALSEVPGANAAAAQEKTAFQNGECGAWLVQGSAKVRVGCVIPPWNRTFVELCTFAGVLEYKCSV